MKKRVRMLALLLSACMTLNMAPLTVYATDVEPGVVATAEETSTQSAPEEQQDDVVQPEEPLDEKIEDETTDIEAPEKTEEEVTVEEDLVVEEGDSQELLEATEQTSNKLFKVDSTGKLEINSEVVSGKGNLPEEINLINMTDGEVKYIPADVFQGNTRIKAIVIPTSVENIADDAFAGCTNLYSVEFENNETSLKVFPAELFKGCTRLANSGDKNLVIPNGLEKISKYCFKGCTSLCVVDFSKCASLKEIGDSAFEGCTNLSELTSFENTAVTTIASEAFVGTAISEKIKFPNTLTLIGDRAFSGCKKLYNIDLSKLSNGEELSIGVGAFADSELKSITFPETYTVLTRGVFKNCQSLTEITLGSSNPAKGIQVIKTGAFDSCNELTKVVLNESVATVEGNAFVSCNNIKDITAKHGKSLEDGNAMILAHDSFPSNSGMVIHGYSGNIEEWVGKHRSDGIVYKTLYAGMEIIYNNQHGGNAVKSSPKTVSVGDTATITATPASGYVLVSLTHGPRKLFVPSGSNNTYKFNVTGADINSDSKIPINAVFANIAKNDTTFSLELAESLSGVRTAKNVDGLRITTDGQSVPLQIAIDSKEYGPCISNPWLWNFTTSNAKCVTVDADGKIKAIATTEGTRDGFATVTATLKSNNKIKLTAKVFVKDTQVFNKIGNVSFDKASKTKYGEETIDGTTIKTVTVSKDWVELVTKEKKTRDVVATVTAKDTNGNNMDVAYSWTSSNKAIATVKADTVNGRNTIKICGVGETVITATSKEKSATTKKNDSISFIVRVVDKTPVVIDSALVINTKSNEGTDFDIASSYGGKLDQNDIKLVTLSNGKWVEGDKTKDFKISSNDDAVTMDNGDYVQSLNIRINTDSNLIGKETSVSGLYVRCLVDETDYVYIQLPTLKITAKVPAPKVTLTGKVNTFYKAVESTKDVTSVTAKVAAVNGYEWDTNKEVSLESLENDTDRIFEKNFTVKVAHEGSFNELIISQKAETLNTDEKNKPVLTGYLVIPYKGNIYSKVKISVGTNKVAPTYVLSQTTVTTNKYSVGQAFDVQLLDKKTKKVIDLTNDFVLDNYAANSSIIFQSEKPSLNVENDEINVKMPAGLSTTSKAVIVVKNKNWNASLTYPLTVKVVGNYPKIVLGTNKIAVNVASSTTNNTSVKMNESYIKNVSIDNDGIVIKTGGKAKLEAEKIKLAYTDGKLVATVDASKDKQPKVGNYVFRVPYTGTFLGDYSYTATVDVTVQIVNKVPAVTLKSTKLTLNDYLYGVTDDLGNPAEIATTTYKLQNLPEGTDLAVDLANANLSNVTTKNVVDYGTGRASWSKAPISISFDNGVLSASLKTTLNGKANKFKITGAKVAGKEIAPIAFTIASINKQPTIKMSPKGTINVLDENAAITYTLSIANYSGTVDPTKLELVNEYVVDPTNGNASTYKKIGSEIKGHFKYDMSSVDGKTIKLIVNDEARSDLEGRGYKLNTDYKFGNGLRNKSAQITITPKPTQTMPKLTQSATQVTVYASNKAYGSSLYIKTANNSKVSIDNVAWSKNTSDTLKKAFATPIYDTKTGKVTIKIKNSALLKKNTTYTLKYCMVNNNQLSGNNAQGTEFTVKVLVK